VKRADLQELAEFEDFVSTLYLAMIRLGTPTLERLVQEGYQTDAVRRAVRVLVNRDLVVQLGRDSWEVRPPEVALPRLAATLEAQARVTRSSARELGVLWRRSRGGDQELQATGVELLQSVDDTVQFMQAAVAQTRKQLCALLDDSPATREFLLRAAADGTGGGGDAREPDVTYVVDIRVLADTEVLQALESLSRAGSEVGVVPSVPFGAVVADDDMGVVDLTHYPPDGAVAFVLRRRTAVRALNALVAAARRVATPLRISADNPDVPLSQRDQRILALLASGATDQVIARHLKVSVRTVERRVRAVMDVLGAGTRFQAGVLAGRRGWI
jgi:DNA-binding CsgD family transcriptional regulator